jgi:Ribbon-helix-helix protein, copG family
MDKAMRRESRTGRFESLEKPSKLISLKLFEDQIEQLEQLSREYDVSKSELIRSFVTDGIASLLSHSNNGLKQLHGDDPRENAAHKS